MSVLTDHSVNFSAVCSIHQKASYAVRLTDSIECNRTMDRDPCSSMHHLLSSHLSSNAYQAASFCFHFQLFACVLNRFASVSNRIYQHTIYPTQSAKLFTKQFAKLFAKQCACWRCLASQEPQSHTGNLPHLALKKVSLKES